MAVDHEMIAVGKIMNIEFKDSTKEIWVEAKIIDDKAWQKIAAGVYTGFAVGGSYLKRWKGSNGLTRYTASPHSIALVDAPVVPTATFTIVKSDGTNELKKFVVSQAVAERLSALTKADAARAGIVIAMPRRVMTSQLVKDALVTSIRHQTGRQVGRRIEFGEVGDGEGNRVLLAHDTGTDEVSIHGVTFGLGEIAPDLRASFNLASAAYVDAAEDAEEQSDAKALLGVVVAAILQRHAFVGDAVKQQQHQRFAAV